jgi:hypothetical protein
MLAIIGIDIQLVKSSRPALATGQPIRQNNR